MDNVAAIANWLIALNTSIREAQWGWLIALAGGLFFIVQGSNLAGVGSYAIGRVVGGIFLPHTFVKGRPGTASTFLGHLLGLGLQLFGLVVLCMGMFAGVDRLLYGPSMPGGSSAAIAHQMFPIPVRPYSP